MTTCRWQPQAAEVAHFVLAMFGKEQACYIWSFGVGTHEGELAIDQVGE